MTQITEPEDAGQSGLLGFVICVICAICGSNSSLSPRRNASSTRPTHSTPCETRRAAFRWSHVPMPSRRAPMPRAALLAFALLFAAPPIRAAEFDPKPVDDVVAKAMAEFQVPGAAVVIVQDDQVVYLKGFGVRELGSDAKVTPDTVFAIASCSKAFTATLVGMLA